LIIPVRQTSMQDDPVQVKGQVTLDIPPEFTPAGPAEFIGQCQRAGEGLFQVSGNLTFGCSTPCARCLKTTSLDLTVPFEERYARPEKIGQDEEIYPFTGDEIDLDLSLNEAANMALPMRVLCGDDCKGLCPHCGADLNESECGCQQPLDSAFSVLKQLT
jgi:uncharacterized protein